MRTVAAGVCALCLAGTFVEAQTARRPELPPNAVGWAGGTSVVSSTTLAMQSVRLDGNSRTLQLLVLWRGSPGWLYRGGSTRGGGSESPTISSERGDVKVEVSMNAATRQIWVQGKPHQLGSANVILVDHVDASDGAQVVGMLTVEPDFEGPNRDGLVHALRVSKELRDFVQCDAKMPDESMQRRHESSCSKFVLPK
jgi:hypothetical protein